MHARDIMEPVHVCASPADTLRTAVRKMRAAPQRDDTGAQGLVVTDARGELVGVISVREILRTIVPAYLAQTTLSDLSWDGMLEQMAQRVANRPVGEIMARDVPTVQEDAPLMECAGLVAQHNLHHVPVLGAGRKPVGMIYTRDLYHAIARALYEEGTNGA